MQNTIETGRPDGSAARIARYFGSSEVLAMPCPPGSSARYHDMIAGWPLKRLICAVKLARVAACKSAERTGRQLKSFADHARQYAMVARPQRYERFMLTSLPSVSKPMSWKFTRKPAAAAASRKYCIAPHQASSGAAVDA